jgi:SAM-dependent methyltransferase
MPNLLSINDLPLHSPWVKKMLGYEEANQKEKNEEEILREYNIEKWGFILKRMQQENECNVDFADSLLFDKDAKVMGYLENEFIERTQGEMHKKHIELVHKNISDFLPAPAVVELGCGYGSVLFKLSKDYLPVDQYLVGAEFAESGIEVMDKIAASEGTNLQTGYCNFFDLNLDGLNIPEGSIIFTSFAACCIPELSNGFLDAILKTKPKKVVHFEPLYEQCGEDLFGLLRRKYMELNDYNRNLLSLLKNHPDVEIESVSEPVFGSNPLLSASVIRWKSNKV